MKKYSFDINHETKVLTIAQARRFFARVLSVGMPQKQGNSRFESGGHIMGYWADGTFGTVYFSNLDKEVTQ